MSRWYEYAIQEPIEVGSAALLVLAAVGFGAFFTPKARRPLFLAVATGSILLGLARMAWFTPS